LDDRRVVEDSLQLAYRRALVAHRRAVAVHEAAADFYDRAGRPDLARVESARADLERERLRAAELLHPEWS
jgi:hypothetical protein